MPLVADYGVSSDESDGESLPSASKGSMKQSVTSSEPGADEVLEDFVKKTNYGDKLPEKPKQLVTPELAKMRLSKANSKGKVKIAMPTLQDDSDDDEPTSKMPKVQFGASGFLGSLPPPQNTLGGKEQGRALLPHRLTQSKTQAKVTKPKPTAPKPTATSTRQTVNKTLTGQPLKSISNFSDSDDDDDDGARGSSGNKYSTTYANVVPSVNANFFSLESGSSHKSVINSAPSNLVPDSLTSNDHLPGTSGTSGAEAMVTAASLYNVVDAETVDDEYAVPTDNASATAAGTTAEPDNLLNSDEFLKMQGKRKRGKEEINIIDINTDDIKASELELTKNLSEEDPSLYISKKKGVGYSGMQKRKHQITYLAHQAKVRELELKNTWAANRQTRRQTQAKYGF